MGGPTGERRQRWPRILAIVFGVIVLSSVYSCGVDLYRAAQRSPKPFVTHGDVPEDHLDAHVRTVSIDTNKGDLVVRVEVRPEGKLTRPDGISVAVPVRIDVAGETGRASYRYAVGDRVSPIEVTVGLVGDVNSYPFDTYEAPVVVRVLALSQSSSDPTDVTAAFPTQFTLEGPL